MDRTAIIPLLLACGLAVAPRPAAAQELSTLAGAMGSGVPHGGSYAWELQYRHRLGYHFAWTAAWINEGHPPGHHRDGLALQGWGVLLQEPGDFSLAIGAGEYRFADTRLLAGDGYTNEHGWTPIVSLAATYYTDSPWFLQLVGNHIDSAHGLQSNSLVAGLGYQLGWKRSVPRAARHRAANTITAMYGRTIVNSRSSEHAAARVLEYRRALGKYEDWTVSVLDEGNPQIMHRRGVATQFWLMDAYLQRRIGLGLGVGPYFVFQREGPPARPTKAQPVTAALLSPTFSCRITSQWSARLTWNRVLSRDNRDADVIVLGLGYRWGDE